MGQQQQRKEGRAESVDLQVGFVAVVRGDKTGVPYPLVMLVHERLESREISTVGAL